MKKRKYIAALIVILGLLTLLIVPAVPVTADNPVVSINVVDAEVVEDSDFIITVAIDSVTDFDVAQYDITYDPAVIEVIDINDGEINGTPIPVSDWDFIPTETQGMIRIINNVEETPGVTGSGYLAEIEFHAVGSAPATSNITLSNGIIGDNEAHKIEATWPADPSSVDIIATVTADFSAVPTEVLVGQEVTFTAIPTGGSGDYTYEWDFDNNGTIDVTETDNVTTYAYASSDIYTVSLTINDVLNGSDTETKPGYITVYDALVATASANVTGVVVSDNISFSANVTGGKPGYTYKWDFDDGTPVSALQNPTHSYAASGNYTITLKVTDALGNTDTDTVDISIYKLGDADGNGTVQALDITYIEHVIMETPGYERTPWADANEDGDWNALDITAIEILIMQEP